MPPSQTSFPRLRVGMPAHAGIQWQPHIVIPAHAGIQKRPPSRTVISA